MMNPPGHRLLEAHTEITALLQATAAGVLTGEAFANPDDWIECMCRLHDAIDEFELLAADIAARN